MLLFIDNIFRFTQAGSEVSALLGRMPSRRRIPAEPGVARWATCRSASRRPRTDRSLRCRPFTCPPTTIPIRLRPPRSPTWTRPPTCRASISELGIYPAVDPLASTSRILDPRIIGEEHYNAAQQVKQILQRYKDLQDIIAILGVDELSDEDKADRRARPQDPTVPVAAVHVAEAFTGLQGQVREGGRHGAQLQGSGGRQARRDSGAGVLHARARSTMCSRPGKT